MRGEVAAGTAAAASAPVVWDLFGLGYKFQAGPFVVTVLVVFIARLCVYLNTQGRRQVLLDVAVTFLCVVIAALWTQAHQLAPLPAGISAMTIAGIGYGLIGIGKSQFASALGEAMRVLFRGMAASDPPAVPPAARDVPPASPDDGPAIDRAIRDLDQTN